LLIAGVLTPWNTHPLHADLRTTGLYDRRNDTVALDGPKVAKGGNFSKALMNR
jgi:hypothetical protein